MLFPHKTVPKAKRVEDHKSSALIFCKSIESFDTEVPILWYLVTMGLLSALSHFLNRRELT